MKKRVLVPTLVVSTLLIGSLVMAGPGGYSRGNCGGYGGGQGYGPGVTNYDMHEDRMERKLEVMSTVLDLTEEQQTRIEALYDQQYQDHQQLREQMLASRDAMHAAQAPGNFNEAGFRAEAAKRAELKTEMMVQKAKLRQQIYDLLTPEQKNKADTLGGMMGGGYGKGHHGGYGF